MTKILIADDVSANRYLLVSLLEGNGYEVVAAADGVEALALAHDSPPDLIVTDIMMPIMDGFELCRRWKADEALKRIPFVVYTATYTDEKDERLAMGLGADRFLIKPQENDTLLRVLREVLDEAGRDPGAVRSQSPGDEMELLRQHNEALLRKLQKKVHDLETVLAARTRAEEELKLRNLILSTQQEASIDGILVVDVNGKIISSNRRFADMWEIPPDVIESRSDERALQAVMDALVRPEEFIGEVKRLYATPEETSRHEIDLRDGRTFDRYSAPMVAEDGRHFGRVWFFRDITARKRAEADLRESAGLAHLAGRMAHLGGWSANLADRSMAFSEEAAATFGVPADSSPSIEEAIGFSAPEWRAQVEAEFGACSRDGTPFDHETEIVSAGGKRVWVRVIGVPVQDASGAITKVQGAIQEITDRKQAEEERKQLHSQLVASQKIEAIGRLAGGVAHDFNNLLSVILSYAGFGIDALREGDPLRADIEEIRKAGERAAALTRQLLAFSRNQLLDPEVLSINKVVTGIESMLRRLLGEDIEIEVHLSDDLGSVVADPGQIEQVIMNLAVNARDAMPEGGKLTIGTANVELDEDYADRHIAVKPGRFVMLSVTDSGCGMDAATREHIFEPFFTTKETGKGTGLGLSTVYGIVKQSGGNIWVYSEPGRGTAFKVYLPRVDAPAAERKHRPASGMPTGSETVLLVEDEEVVRTVVERMLRRAGYAVLAAANGGEALLLCEKHPGKAYFLLTDVVMPQIGGPELAERIATLCPGIKTLYMSGYTASAIVQQGMLKPGPRFIGKPFSAAELTRKVREALDDD